MFWAKPQEIFGTPTRDTLQIWFWSSLAKPMMLFITAAWGGNLFWYNHNDENIGLSIWLDTTSPQLKPDSWMDNLVLNHSKPQTEVRFYIPTAWRCINGEIFPLLVYNGSLPQGDWWQIHGCAERRKKWYFSDTLKKKTNMFLPIWYVNSLMNIWIVTCYIWLADGVFGKMGSLTYSQNRQHWFLLW